MTVYTSQYRTETFMFYRNASNGTSWAFIQFFEGGGGEVGGVYNQGDIKQIGINGFLTDLYIIMGDILNKGNSTVHKITEFFAL